MALRLAYAGQESACHSLSLRPDRGSSHPGNCICPGPGARKKHVRLPDLPSQDRIALALIGGIVLVGFVLEGMRIAMTGFPGGAEWAFVGYGIGAFLSQVSDLVNIYGYVWYFHALLSGAFLAYLPSAVCFISSSDPWCWLEMRPANTDTEGDKEKR